MRAFSSHAVFFSLFAVAVTGCGGGGGTVEVGVTAQPLQVAAPPAGDTDADAQMRLALTIGEVSVHVAGDAKGDGVSRGEEETSTEDEGADEAGWITVFSGEAEVDLLDAMSIEELLGSSEVPAGKITQVRLVLAGAELVDGTIRTPISCPSCSESGLKIVTRGETEVSPGGTLHLTLDVDQASSLTQDESGYRLDPVIKVTATER